MAQARDLATSVFPNDIFNLADIALEVARNDPERIAVIEPRGRDARGKRRYRHYSYLELSRAAESLAPGLREIGIAEGTRTVFMAPPSFEASVVGLALTRVGALQIWIDPSVGLRNVGERLRRVEPEAFVGIPLAHVGRSIFGWGPRVLRKAIVVGAPGFPFAHSVSSLYRDAPKEPSQPAVRPEDPVAILYTTGSTGPAKPTLYSHRNYSNVYRIAHRSWRFDETEGLPIDMAAFPAFFFIALSRGGTVVVPPIQFSRQGPADADPKAILEVVEDCGVKSMFASPALLENLAAYANRHGIKTSSLERIVGGGAPIRGELMAELLEMMGERGEVFANYGATEALPTTEMGANEVVAETWKKTQNGAGICVGRTFPGVEVGIIRITDSIIQSIDDASMLKPGEIGEIIVRSPHISEAYYRDEANTKKHKLRDPRGGIWHRIGDAGYLDEQKRLWVTGRVGQRVKAEGEPLFSIPCEAIFDTHPKVRKSGLVGIPSNGVEIPVICIELKSTLDASEELRHELLMLAGRHPTTRGVRQLLFHPKLPVDPRHNSKIERPLLAKWAKKQLEAEGRLNTEVLAGSPSSSSSARP